MPEIYSPACKPRLGISEDEHPFIKYSLNKQEEIAKQN